VSWPSGLPSSCQYPKLSGVHQTDLSPLPGVGNTHLAIALGIAAEAGYRAYVISAVDLVNVLQSAQLEGRPNLNSVPTSVRRSL